MSGSDHKVLISISGELDAEQLPVLRDVVEAALDAVRRPDRVEIDLRGASSVDAAGLRLVASMVDAGVRLVVDECGAGLERTGG